MGRRPQPEIRERLLDACTDHVLAHGLPDRLAPLVAATGVSARMLLYHFGSRDALVLEVRRRARRRQSELYGALLRARDDEPYTATLRRAWTVIAGPDGLPYLRLFAQWRPAAAETTFPDRQSTTVDWLGPLAEGLATLGRPDLATLTLAVFRGLLMDLDATDDRARTTAAFDDFLRSLPGGPEGTGPRAVQRTLPDRV